MTAKVVVFGIDGVRLDTLHATGTPHLDKIISNGFLSTVRIPDINPTVSGPCWATIASGVHSDVHGITTNEMHGNHLDQNPCFLTRAAHTGLGTYAAAGWLPLLTTQQGGPIFRPHTRYTPPRPPHSKTGGDAESDQAVTDHAAAALRDNPDIDIAFVYIGQVDETAHQSGTGTQYAQAIGNADTCIGQVMTAIAQRPDYSREQWTYLAVTDHGHRDGGGHGGNTDLERTAWIAGCGPTLAATDTTKLGHADIPRLALSPFGITV